MKIAFFTETGSTINHFERKSPNIRTDTAWKIALNAVDFNLYSEPMEVYDLGIFIIPKKCEDGRFDLSIWREHFDQRIKPKLKKVAVMQEGPSNFWQDYRVSTQIQFLQFLNDADLILCHNEFDVCYYKGLIPHKTVSVLQSLIIEDSIPVEAKKVDYKRFGTMIGGNWVSWYSGQDSYFIAQELGEKIYAPSMGRKQEYEDYLEDIKYLPYLNWSKWMIELSTKKYAVHLMRTWAAGTFALNCAYLGIPCIGYNGLDTQKICFPELSVNLGDLEKARKIAKHLKENEQFYLHCSEYAKKAYYDNYREEIFIKKTMGILNGI